MVFEVLKYKTQSTVLELTDVVLQPEITSEIQPCFIAEIADTKLLAETFYRLHRITAIKVGRIPGHETRVRYNYDPIITIENGYVDFETFSLDMCNYAKATFNEDAFKNVEQWDCGVTNVDFSKQFIKKIRDSRELKNVFIDRDGIEVLSESESMIEKKIPLPENWETALESIKTNIDNFEERPSESASREILSRIPFNPFLKRFAEIEKTWKSPNGWDFIEMKMRNDLGKVQVVVTPNQLERMDGRKNIDYQKIRSSRNLRKVKSYYLDVQDLGKNEFLVSGGAKPHKVIREGRRLVCDCGGAVYRRNRNCKHVRAINRPKLMVIHDIENEFTVSDGQSDFKVQIEDNKLYCNCFEFKQTNICQHLAFVLKYLDDYQYKEVKLDLSG